MVGAVNFTLNERGGRRRARVNCPVLEIRVEEAALLAEGESLRFILNVKNSSKEAFVLRYQGELLAFLNECPHWSVELDLGDGHFFDSELNRIYCKNHGALFTLPDGQCETGPCLGRQLTRYPLRVEENDVWVEV